MTQQVQNRPVDIASLSGSDERGDGKTTGCGEGTNCTQSPGGVVTLVYVMDFICLDSLREDGSGHQAEVMQERVDGGFQFERLKIGIWFVKVAWSDVAFPDFEKNEGLKPGETLELLLGRGEFDLLQKTAS